MSTASRPGRAPVAEEDFTGRTAFVTGAASGQGRAVALALAERGANIVAVDLGKPLAYPEYLNKQDDALGTLVAEIADAGGAVRAHRGDVRDGAFLARAAREAEAEFGGVDILFANAGISAYGYAHELTEEEWDAVLDINLKGVWLSAKAVIPGMIARRRGVIVANSSIAGLRGLSRLSHYAAAKWGVTGLVKSLAIELAPHGIRAVSIHPTGVDTQMNDGLAAMEGTTPEEIAERSAGNLLPVPWVETWDVVQLVLFLASDRARYITGSQFVLDAGLLTR
ncbi:SDR family oxidoreductase [Propionicicella superfundia]|uniref:SDR family oxidoreductase n=1 Tax=Propionicicella superfundia TaxID=348582 RepID=UPI0003FD3CB3|nr:SDR family oxidoreductase [Propionicicella superfundia]